MVQFAKKLAAAQRPEWKGHYLEYKQLKKKLRKVVEAQREETREEQENFKQALDSEVERVVLFFLTKQGEFATTLQGLRTQQLELAPGDLEAMHLISDMYRHIGDELVNLLHFVELNATGIRKILKKHDKTLKEHKIMGSYLSSRTDSQASHMQQLYHDEGISAIIASIRAALTKLRKLEVQLAADASNKALTRTISEDEPVLNRIGQARRRLHKSTQYVKTVAARSLIFDAESSEDEDDETYDMLKRLKQASEPSRLLNMLNTFLYMTNYYIVAPTSGKYAAELGAEASMSGVIVGMTPVASLASAVLYSWWANRSYKASLSFATVCLILGNLLYGMALSYDSVAMALAGRMLNGFGGARAINRRYIADNYSREERTQASALFVTASALGMAAGPALAAALHYLPDYNFAGIDITTETSPGWVMFVLWTVYLIALLVWFVEPDRMERERFLDHRRSMLENGMGNSSIAVVAAQMGETTPLISRSYSMGSPPPLSSLWRNVPVVASLFIYIVLKLVLECLITASSTIAMYHFNWGSTNNGMYLAALGLLMFPTNMVVGWMSFRYEDREMIMFSEIAMFVGVGIIVNYGHYSVAQFVVGGVIIFISTNVLEGVNMSLLSKTIPKSFAKGTFNSGLLATEAGTFGRAIGDIAITVVGLPGIQYVLNWTFVPLIAVSLLTILYTGRVYHKLATDD
ncbi:SPX domain-containing membrane protein [Phytophthora cactorum]|uniref:SPX domain-containing membrane protein n=1 Tax=Phytophthora cactorum TaxID=29920 RepID=A0A8T0Y992_9STRA|nr:SPX domain-containing membrane protein [Phytophthora cactorum]KAG2805470.1 SPX domain-containing membrane protein [Phytophthora cactorum]KAG2818254.1 SPX domain-containing membrane protein [Phytophthora cactorum]KAG2845422.1 SPX domain-containing membrane protein [Phytophthora cactorum]KAG2895878.1 SPX domain-containing membrane protein [Phytophthora cactorum]